MSKHTPEPWIIEDEGDRARVWSEDWGTIVYCENPYPYANTNELADGLEEAFANARLIAAAPDLLKALKYMMLSHGHHNGCPNVGSPVHECHECYGGDLQRMARAAISKANS